MLSNDYPSHLRLEQNYPNPFNPSTTIEFALPKAGIVSLKVFDIVGREVAILVNESMQPGYYRTQFNASALSSGVYFYHIQAGDFSQTKKFVLLR
ncbi:MAG: T9SS type A sorting domain-containing protein [Bacteroidetes bacterium]|nr:T9SS type A sorting domain-containing protein [Bacteroidota bacterium]MCW5894075.1 T9SS type A sorting domain-containing protein [Bacteroidota bacterium]